MPNPLRLCGILSMVFAATQLAAGPARAQQQPQTAASEPSATAPAEPAPPRYHLGAGGGSFGLNTDKSAGQPGGGVEMRVHEAGEPMKVEASYGNFGGNTTGHFDATFVYGKAGVDVGAVKTPFVSHLWADVAGYRLNVLNGYILGLAGVAMHNDLQPNDRSRAWSQGGGQLAVEGRLIMEQVLKHNIVLMFTLAGGTRVSGGAHIEPQDEKAPDIEIRQKNGGAWGSIRASGEIPFLNQRFYVKPEVIVDLMDYKSTVTTNGVSRDEHYGGVTAGGVLYIGVSAQ